MSFSFNEYKIDNNNNYLKELNTSMDSVEKYKSDGLKMLDTLKKQNAETNNSIFNIQNVIKSTNNKANETGRLNCRNFYTKCTFTPQKRATVHTLTQNRQWRNIYC